MNCPVCGSPSSKDQSPDGFQCGECGEEFVRAIETMPDFESLGIRHFVLYSVCIAVPPFFLVAVIRILLT